MIRLGDGQREGKALSGFTWAPFQLSKETKGAILVSAEAAFSLPRVNISSSQHADQSSNGEGQGERRMAWTWPLNAHTQKDRALSS